MAVWCKRWHLQLATHAGESTLPLHIAMIRPAPCAGLGHGARMYVMDLSGPKRFVCRSILSASVDSSWPVRCGGRDARASSHVFLQRILEQWGHGVLAHMDIFAFEITRLIPCPGAQVPRCCSWPSKRCKRCMSSARCSGRVADRHVCLIGKTKA